MKETFEELDKWEDVPKKRCKKNGLEDCAILNKGGIFSIAHNVTKQLGNPISVKVQRMEQEGMFFIRIMPVKKDPTSRTITYGENTQAGVLVARSLVTPSMEGLLPLMFELVRANEKEMVFVAKPNKE